MGPFFSDPDFMCHNTSGPATFVADFADFQAQRLWKTAVEPPVLDKFQQRAAPGPVA